MNSKFCSLFVLSVFSAFLFFFFLFFFGFLFGVFFFANYGLEMYTINISMLAHDKKYSILIDFD